MNMYMTLYNNSSLRELHVHQVHTYGLPRQIVRYLAPLPTFLLLEDLLSDEVLKSSCIECRIVY